DPAAVDQLRDHAFAEMLDVHGAARAEVEEPLLELGGAGAVGAAPPRLALRAHRGAAAGRTVVGHLERHGAGGTLLLDDAHEIWDHAPRALDEHGVPHPDVLAAHLALVVQADRAPPHARELHRLE